MTSALGLSLCAELLLGPNQLSSGASGWPRPTSPLHPPLRARLTLHVWMQDHEEEGPGQCGRGGDHPGGEQVGHHQAQVRIIEASLGVPLGLGHTGKVSPGTEVKSPDGFPLCSGQPRYLIPG